MKRSLLLVIVCFCFYCVHSQPTITSISPTSGPVGTTVTITGTGFSTTAANNIVYFGGIKVNVQTAPAPTATALTVKVPAGANSQPISVTTGNLTAYSATSFDITFVGGGVPFVSSSFPSATGYTSNLGNKVYTGDLDNDFKSDVVILNTSTTLSVYRNQSTSGTISFGAEVDHTLGSVAKSASVGDIDGDGKLDIVTGNSAASVTILRNTTTTAGSITFATNVDITAITGGVAKLADIDGDGKIDIIVGGGSSLSLLRNTSTPGTISFATHVELTTANPPVDFAVGDVDADGKPDIAYVLYNSNLLSIIKNTSTVGSFSFATNVDFPTIGNPYNIIMSDLDNDGKLDFAVTNNWSIGQNMSVFRNTSNGSISLATRSDIAVSPIMAGAIASDLDGDGKKDLVFYNEDIVNALRNTSSTGALSFEPQVQYTFGLTGNSQNVEACDIDGDGRPDIINVPDSGSKFFVARNRVGEPSISSFTPSTGAIGTTINITGAYFNGVTSVSFGGTAASSFVINSPTSLSAVVGNGTTGSVSVVSSTGSSSLAGFTFNNAPVINSFSPTATGQGNVVTITGVRFTGATAVSFGGTAASLFTVVSPTTITATVSTGTTGSVSVTTPYGTGTKTGFTFVPPPTVTNLSASSGTIGTTITITGTNFTGATTVSFGGAASSIFTVNSATSITATIEAGASGSVTVTTPGGQGSIGGFTFIPGPSITSFSPASGPAGSTVTIAGTNFSSTAANNVVYFGSVKAAVTAATAKSLSVTVPTGTSYQPITVTTGNLTAYAAKPFDITFSGGSPIATTSFGPFTNLVTVASGSNFVKPAFGDIDGDGKPDLVSNTSGVSAEFTIFPNTSVSPAVSYGDAIYYTASDFVHAVALADIDGDGKLDVVLGTGGGSTPKISVYKNTSTPGSFHLSSPTDIALTGIVGSGLLLSSEIDGDGRPDIVIAGGSTLVVLRNTTSGGTISFAQSAGFTVGSFPVEYAIGDLNGDGKNDIASAQYNDSNVGILKNTSVIGSVSFAPVLSITTKNNPNNIALGDIDGDGAIDIGVTYNNFSSFTLLHNTSTAATLSFTTQDFASETYETDIAINDLDGDGKPDVTVSNTGQIMLFRNTSSSGSFSFDASVTLPKFIYYGNLILGDADGDSKPDILSFNYNSPNSINTISAIRNQSGEPVITSFSPLTAGSGETVNISGVNFTGATDVSFGGTPAASYSVVSATSITAVVGTGASGNISVTNSGATQKLNGFSFYNGPVITSFSPNNGPMGTTVTIQGKRFSTDVSGNVVRFGATTAVVSTATSTQLVVKVPAGATYQPITVTTAGLTTSSSRPFNVTFANGGSISSSSFTNKTDFTSEQGPQAPATGDLDGDGKADVVIVNYASNTVSIFRNTSSGGVESFDTKLDYPGDDNPTGVVLSDFDGDGKLDIAVSSSSANILFIYKNTSTPGSLSFLGQNLVITGTNPQNIAAGDLDGDGKPDLATANFSGDNTVSLYRNTSAGGTISFDAKQDIKAGGFPSFVAIGELTGDGLPEVVVANSTDNTISIFNNISSSGLFSFQLAQSYSTGSFPASIAIGDLNGDLHQDIAVANYSSSSISIFKNFSSSFGKTDYATGSTPNSVAIGDLNGDGYPDVATANLGTNINTVSVLQNTGIDFTVKTDYTTGLGPSGIAIGDVNGDGFNNIVVTNSIGNSFSVLSGATARILSFTPTTATAGQTVTISGTNLSGATAISFGGTPATSFSQVSATTITAVVGAGSSGSVSVTTPNGTPSRDGFTYIDSPTITSISPTSAKTGDTVTINGTSLGGVTAVSFGGTAAASFTIVSTTSITAIVGDGATGDVLVTTPSGSAKLSGFTYLPVTAIEDESGGNIFEVNIFPNPASQGGDLNLSFHPSWDGKKVGLLVMDMTGQTICDTNFVCRKNTPWSSIQSQPLSEGFYIIAIQMDNKKIMNKVVILK